MGKSPYRTPCGRHSPDSNIIEVRRPLPQMPKGKTLMKPQTEGLKMFIKVYDLCMWMMQKTVKFPKSQRFVLAQKIDNILIGMLESIVVANMRKDKSEKLIELSESLERLRILLRLSKDMTFLPLKGYEFATKEVDEIGRMLGGWIKQQKAAPIKGSDRNPPGAPGRVVEQQPELCACR